MVQKDQFQYRFPKVTCNFEWLEWTCFQQVWNRKRSSFMYLNPLEKTEELALFFQQHDGWKVKIQHATIQ